MVKAAGFGLAGEGFTSSMKQVSGVKAEVDLDAAAPRLSFKYCLVL
jgi:hypothetical protein